MVLGRTQNRAAIDPIVISLKQSRSVGELRQIQHQVEQQKSTYLSNLLLQMYGRFDAADCAQAVFDSMPDPNEFSWTFLLSAYARTGNLERSKGVFDAMTSNRCHDVVSWTILLKCYAESGSIDEMEEFYGKIPARSVVSFHTVFVAHKNARNWDAAFAAFVAMPQHDLFSWTGMIQSLASSGRIDSARDLFEKISMRNAMCWNSMLAAFAESGHLAEAKTLFDSMPEKNEVSWNAMLETSQTDATDLEQYAERVPQLSIASWRAIVAANAAAGNVSKAKKVFDSMPEHSASSWSAMITAFAASDPILAEKMLLDKSPRWDQAMWTSLIQTLAEKGHLDRAAKLLEIMPQRTPSLYRILVRACQQQDRIDLAKVLFDCASDRDDGLWNATLFVLARAGDIELAESIFARMPQYNAVSCTEMIIALSAAGQIDHARRILDSMPETDLVARTSMLQAYAREGHLEQARSLFDSVDLRNRDAILWNTMITAYAQSGDRDRARQILEEMPERDVMAWTTLVAQEQGLQAIAVVAAMELEGIYLVNLLGACGHDGFVAAAADLFRSMRRDYGVDPGIEHYTAMLLALGRVGMIDAAQELVESMPFEPDSAMWGEILSACQIHGEVDRAMVAAMRLGEIDRHDSAPHVSFGNILLEVES